MAENQNVQNKKPSLEFFIWEVFLFSLTLFLGITTAFQISKFMGIGAQQNSVSPISPWQFIFSFAVGTLLILSVIFFIKSKTKKGIIFKGLFIFFIFWGILLTLDIWLESFFSIFGAIISLFLAIYLTFLLLKKPSVLIHNICMILGISGVGAVLGLRITPETMILLLIVFSVYDFIAVYKTKHMVTMAKEMVEHKAILAFIIPPKMADFQGNIAEVKPGGKFLILGGGDIVFPLMLCSSLITRDIFSSLIVAIFSIIGLIFSFFIFTLQKERKAIPALPPIALFCILGYLITLII
jgi:presenilin-like A22 family membrane protease